jgi:hypothetical protein
VPVFDQISCWYFIAVDTLINYFHDIFTSSIFFLKVVFHIWLIFHLVYLYPKDLEKNKYYYLILWWLWKWIVLEILDLI